MGAKDVSSRGLSNEIGDRVGNANEKKNYVKSTCFFNFPLGRYHVIGWPEWKKRRSPDRGFRRRIQ